MAPALLATNDDGIRKRRSHRWSPDNEPSLESFKALCRQQLRKEDYPLCSEVIHNVPIYDATSFDLQDEQRINELANEFHDILDSTSGVFVLRGMYQDVELLEKVNSLYEKIILSEKQLAKGDHFGKGGLNERIWNGFGKHAMLDPVSFFDYYSNPWMSVVCNSWLGPCYRVTAQVNIVKPGGAPQTCHRDYHLGFLDADTCRKFPLALQIASQYLTLQGAVAHSDMPVESGPTRILPFSQNFEEGYMAYRLPAFAEYFADNYVSLPLKLGDGLFFNPALFHAAGKNETSSHHRIANLLQVSSAFGKPMELVDTLPLIKKCWPVLQARYDEQGMSASLQAFVNALGEGYPFPVNLDLRPPQPNGMAPESEQDLLRQGLEEHWTTKKLLERLGGLRAP